MVLILFIAQYKVIRQSELRHLGENKNAKALETLVLRSIKDGTCVRSTNFQVDISNPDSLG